MGIQFLRKLTYASDQRRPMLFTPWQRLEFRNSVRLAAHRLDLAGAAVPFQIGNVFKRIEQDLSAGRLMHRDLDWNSTLRLAEDLSDEHTVDLGTAAVDLGTSPPRFAKVDTFWTFDREQRVLALATKAIRKVPDLLGK
jgi:hypothetical protein